MKYLYTLYGFFISCLIMAQILFPGGYSIKEYYISDQGSTTQNPAGCWFFIIGTAITSISLIPHLLYIHHKLMPRLAPLNFLMTLSGIIGCGGLFVVAVVPNSLPDLEHIHDWGANFAFGGLGLAAFFSFLIGVFRVFLKEEYPKILHFIGAYSLIIGVGLGLVLFTGTVQQWFGLFTILVWGFLVPLIY